MRTKTLLLSAVLGALSCASLMAQVYSLNAVGYINVTCPAADPNTGAGGWTIIANQLNSGNNVITNLIPISSAMAGDALYKFNPFTQVYTVFSVNGSGQWAGGDATTATLNPGEAAFFYNANDPVTFTFVGTVLQGSLTNSLVAADPNTGAGGFSLVSSIVPQAGNISTNLGLAIDSSMAGDAAYVYDITNQVYHVSSVNGSGQWSPTSPSVNVGQGFFFYNANTTLSWTRTFTVN
jgi:hypothetical protein